MSEWSAHPSLSFRLKSHVWSLVQSCHRCGLECCSLSALDLLLLNVSYSVGCWLYPRFPSVDESLRFIWTLHQVKVELSVSISDSFVDSLSNLAVVPLIVVLILQSDHLIFLELWLIVGWNATSIKLTLSIIRQCARAWNPLRRINHTCHRSLSCHCVYNLDRRLSCVVIFELGTLCGPFSHHFLPIFLSDFTSETFLFQIIEHARNVLIR